MSKFEETIRNIDCLTGSLNDVEVAVRKLEDEDVSNFSDSIRGKIKAVVSEWNYIVTEHLVKTDE